MTTSAKGDLSVAKVLAAFSSKGVPVLIPWGNSQRYDLVVDIFGHLVRVQVKTGALISKYSINFHSSSTTCSDRTTRDYCDDTEIFAVYVPSWDSVYIVPTKHATTTKTVISIARSEGNRNAEDCEFEAYWTRLLAAVDSEDKAVASMQLLKFLCGI